MCLKILVKMYQLIQNKTFENFTLLLCSLYTSGFDPDFIFITNMYKYQSILNSVPPDIESLLKTNSKPHY